MTDRNPTNKPVLIVTGASRGIGAAVARHAADAGYAVAINYRTQQAEAEELAEEIVANGGSAIAVHGDMSQEADIIALYEAAERELGPIAAVVNNAAITGGFARVEAVTAEQIDSVLATNVRGTLLSCREAVKRMSTRHGGQGGAIVNLSSLAYRKGSPGDWVHYAMTKGAVATLTLGLAREVATEGIRVNAVAPGLIDTDMATSGDPDRPERIRPEIPMQRLGNVDEIASAVLWLLSPGAGFTTAAILEIGGGN